MSYLKQFQNRICEHLLIYTLLKEICYKFNIPIANIILYLISILLTPLWIIGLVTMYVSHLAVFTYLKIKHGDKVHPMHGTDNAMNLDQDSSKLYIFILYLIEYNGDPEKFYEDISDRMYNDVYLTTPKFQLLRKTCLGYPYYYHQKFAKEVFLNKVYLKPNCSNKEFLSSWQDILISKMPCNGEAMCRIHIGMTPIKGNLYPVMNQLHHSLGDGMATFNNQMRTLFDCRTEVVKRPELKMKIDNWLFWTMFKHANLNIYKWISSLDEILRIQNIGRAVPNDNRLSSKFSGKKFISSDLFGSEEALQKIKEIKANVPNATFLAILITLTGKTVHNFLTKFNEKSPEEMEIGYTQYPYPITQKEYGTLNELTNRALANSIKTPFNSQQTLLERLKITSSNHHFTNNKTINLQFIQYTASTGGIYPAFLPKLLVPLVFRQILGITNVPLSDHYQTVNNWKIKEITGFAPNLYNFGLTYTFSSYAKKFTVSIQVDHSIAPTQDHADFLVTNFRDNLNELHTEVMKNYKVRPASL